MRTLLTLVFFVFASTYKGQTVYSYHGGLMPGGVGVGNRVFFTEKTFDGCCKYLNFFVTAKNGQVISRIGLSGSYSPNNNTPVVDATADQHLAVVSGSFSGGSCDVIPWPRPVVFKFDTNGILKWQLALNKFSVSHVLGLADSSIVYVSGNKLYRLNSFGVPTDSLLSGFGAIQSMCRFGKDSFLVNHLSGTTSKIKKVSNKLIAGADVVISTTVERMQVLHDSSLLALAAGNLVFFNKALVQQYSSNTQTTIPGYSISSFTAVCDSIYCTGVGNSGGQLHYSILDKSFSQLYHVMSNFRYAEPKGITLSGNKLNILAGCPVPNSYNPWIDLIQLDKKGTITSVSDVGVTSATLDATFFKGQYFVGNVNSTVIVKNFGSNPVEYFQVNFVGLGVNWCDASMMTKRVHHHLDPGDSVAVNLPWFQTRLYGVEYGSTAEFCFYSTVPNATHDFQTQNDQFCASTLVVGIAEDQNKDSFKVFPNPGSAEIQLQGDVAITLIEILDLTGRVLMQSEMSNKKSCTISHALPDGVYLLRIRAGDQDYLRKVAVQN